jgi:hypothetical protein
MDPDSIGSEEPDPNQTSVSGSRESKNLDLFSRGLDASSEILGLGFSKNVRTLDSGFIEGWFLNSRISDPSAD